MTVETTIDKFNGFIIYRFSIFYAIKVDSKAILLYKLFKKILHITIKYLRKQLLISNYTTYYLQYINVNYGILKIK